MLPRVVLQAVLESSSPIKLLRPGLWEADLHHFEQIRFHLNTIQDSKQGMERANGQPILIWLSAANTQN